MGMYEQHLKHSRNHRKDRYYQQCSGYFGKSLEELRAEEERQKPQVIEFFIVDRNKNVLKKASTWEEIIEIGKSFKNKENYYITSTEMLMGRLDLYYRNIK